MTFRSALTLLLLTLILACPSWGGMPDLRFDSFERFTVEDGLPHSRVHKILQDRHGFLWIATQNGLARFDGYHFRVYENHHNDPTSLGHNYVRDLYEDPEGNLWISTSGRGLDRFDPTTGIFHHYRHDPADPQHDLRDNLSALTVAPNGRLWISTGLGISILDRANHLLVPHTNPQEIQDQVLQDSSFPFWDSRGSLWFVSPQQLLRIDDQGHHQAYPYDPSNPQGLPFELPEGGIYEDGMGRLWLYGLQGLMRYDRQTDSFSIPQLGLGSPQIPILALHEDMRGTLWIGTAGHGLICLDREGQISAHYRHHPSDGSSLGSDIIFSIFEDRTGVLWFGTNGGLDQLDPERQVFARYGEDPANPQSPQGEILAIHQDHLRQTWLGTFGQGLVRIDQERQKAVHFRHDPADPQSLAHNFVWAIHEDHTGQLWVGTEDGVDRLQLKSGQTTFRHARFDPQDPQSLSSNRVLTFLQDAAGTLWLGTNSGLNRYDPTTDRFHRYNHDPEDPESLAKSPILAMSEYPPGTLWLGMDGGGLQRFDSESGRVVQHYRHDPDVPQSLSNNIIAHLYWDNLGQLWIATVGGGLERFDPETGNFFHHRKEQGFPSNSLSALLPDDQGNLWVSHKRGLIRFHPATGEARTFDSGDGLLSGGFNSKAAWRSPSGELLFGGAKGFVRFSPDQVTLNPYPPTVAITSLEILNQQAQLQRIDPTSPLKHPIEQTESLVLDHRHRSISLEFSALHFANPKANRYSYMLEGIDPTWRATNADRRYAQYSNLPPGGFTFHVRASNNDGVWSDEAATLHVLIKPPLWRTWWAWALYGLTAILALAAFAYSQKKKVAREQAISQRLRQVDRLKDEFLANTSHELRTPLHGMVGLAESLLDGVGGSFPPEARSTLQMIVTSGQRLGHLVNDILDFSKLRQRSLDLRLHPVDLSTAVDVVLTVLGPIAANKKLELVQAIPSDLPPVLADENRLQQILYNLVGNAIKFTSRGKVEVDAIVGDGVLETRVKDTGPGIPEEQHERIFESFERALEADSGPGGTGLGLAITRKLVELHGGQIHVDSALGAGSTLRFTLPIANAELAAAMPAPAVEIPTIKSTLQSTPEPVEPPPNVVPPTPEDTAAHILVVDDEPINRQVLKNHLGLRHFQVTEAADGQQAVDLVTNHGPFDLVLLDLMMPGLSGYEVCRRLRMFRSRQDLPVIFLTARGRDVDLAQGLSMGANDYLIKPVSKAELIARVEMHLDLLQTHRHMDLLVAERTAQLKMLSGLLPMCSSCKKVRSDDGYWSEVETYLDEYSEAEVTHGLCPDCAATMYPEYYAEKSVGK